MRVMTNKEGIMKTRAQVALTGIINVTGLVKLGSWPAGGTNAGVVSGSIQDRAEKSDHVDIVSV